MAADDLQDRWEDFDMNVLIPSEIWTKLFWDKYLASYGVALGDFNIGMARAMQKDISSTNSDCFLRSLHASNAIKNTFDINFYTNQSFNIPDIYMHVGQIAIGLTDQYIGCQYDLFLEQLESRFTPQILYRDGLPFQYELIDYAAMLSKLLMSFCVLLIDPERSDFYVSYQYFFDFYYNGGFQNLGASF